MKITTCIILTGRAEEAAEFYAEALGASIDQRVPDGRGGLMLATLTAAGHELVILNGTGPEADIESQRVTLQLHVDGQQEFDRYWDALVEGGEPSNSGWLKDRFGCWWDIVPVQLMELTQRSASDPAAMQRLMAASAKMQRVDLAELERAVTG